MGSPIKPSDAPRADPSNNGPADNSGAMIYLNMVKEMGKDVEFVKVMQDFRGHRISTKEVIARIKQMFEGHDHLIHGFNTFLPENIKITIPEGKKPVDYNQAITYVNKIKQRFNNDQTTYQSFLDVLYMYRKENMPVAQVYQEVANIFHNHHDLLEEFTHFLPGDDSMSRISEHASPFVRQDERSYDMPKTRLANAEKTYLRANYIPSIDSRHQEHDRCTKGAEKEEGWKDDINQRDHDEKFENDDKDLYAVPSKSKPSRRIEDWDTENLLRGGEGDEHLGTYNTPSTNFDDKKALKGVYNKHINFCERVNERLDADTYQQFLKCIYSNKSSSVESMNKVRVILEKYPDLMDGVNDFLPQCENIGNMSAAVKIKDRDRDRVHGRDETNGAYEKENDQERDILDKGASFVSQDATRQNSTHFSTEEHNYLWKPVSELDLSDSQRCTPSYRLLPKDYPIPPAKSRTKLDKSVLNDFWVSVTSGSEDSSFKHTRKNQYEEILFKCEDDRYELDMLIESMDSTAGRLGIFLEKVQANIVEPDSSVRIEDHFTCLNLRCIERLYGDYGLDFMGALHKNPCSALPIILTRLNQKREEWFRFGLVLKRIWSEIHAQNYHKSLDHRSLDFKQQEKKSLSKKALLAEIKKVAEEGPRDDDMLLAIPAGNRRFIVPNMEFEYIDSDIHEVLYQIIKYSCGEVFTSSEQVDKIMKIWTCFLEPMLDIPSQLHGSEDTIGVVKKKGHGVKSSEPITKEGNGEQGHRGDSFLRAQEDLCRAKVPSWKTTSTGNGFRDLDQVDNQNGSCGGIPLHDRLQNSAPMVGEMSGMALKTTSTELLMHNASLSGNVEDTCTRNALEFKLGVKSGTDLETVLDHRLGAILSSKGEDSRRPKISVNGVCTTEDSVTKIDNISVCGQFQGRPREVDASCVVVAAQNDVVADEDDDDNVDEGEESDQMSIEANENASVAGEGISFSEYDDDNECSHEDPEEEEDANSDNESAKVESEGEAEGMIDAHDAEGERASLSYSERLRTSKSFAEHAPAALHVNEEKGSRIFYGNDSFYMLFRLHQTLYTRILSAKVNSSTIESNWRTSKDTHHPDQFTKFLGSLYNLLDGVTDHAKFEDECRTIVGTQSYVLFTLDKLILKLVKQLEVVASNEMNCKLLRLYWYEGSSRNEVFSDLVYHENARSILHDENLYRCESSSNPSRLSIQLMEWPREKPEVPDVSVEPNFSTHLNSELLPSVHEGKEMNKQKYTSGDENSSHSKVMDGVQIVNDLDCKISSNSSKVCCVPDTEDYLKHMKKRKRANKVNT